MTTKGDTNVKVAKSKTVKSGDTVTNSNVSTVRTVSNGTKGLRRSAGSKSNKHTDNPSTTRRSGTKRKNTAVRKSDGAGVYEESGAEGKGWALGELGAVVITVVALIMLGYGLGRL